MARFKPKQWHGSNRNHWHGYSENRGTVQTGISKDHIIWFNPYGNEIVLGKKMPDPKGLYLWLYTYGDLKFGVDSYGVIWSQTDFGTQFKVGNIEEIVYE